MQSVGDLTAYPFVMENPHDGRAARFGFGDKLAAVLLLPRQGEEEESLFYLAGIERKASDYQVRRRMHRFVF